MFKLELDLSLCFVPPMNESDLGITVTRTLDLPFPPTDGLYITGVAFDEQPTGQGMKIADVTWDLDRKKFWATANLAFGGFPIAEIPRLICEWIDRGWRLGSYEDTYEQELVSRIDTTLIEPIIDVSLENIEEVDRWPTMNPRSRPPKFNKFLRAMACEMAVLHNNWDAAYAIDQTKTFFTKKQLKGNESRAAVKFSDALSEFDSMTLDQQLDWREKITRKRPPARPTTKKA